MRERLVNMSGRAWSFDRRFRHVPLLAVLLALGLAAAAATTLTPILGSSEARASESTAEEFVVNSPTFLFDGIEGTFRLESGRQMQYCPGCYEYIFYFESRHPGVGDRTGIDLRSYNTPHRAVVNLVDNKVMMGVLDESWDIGRQLIIDRE